MSGYADITVPGYVAGLPIGITFIGGRWAEPELLGLAFDYEQATKVLRSAAVHPDDRRRTVPGLPNPAARRWRSRRQPRFNTGAWWASAEALAERSSASGRASHPFGHRNASRLGGQYVSFAGPMRLLRGTVPHVRESQEWMRLSPRTK